VPFADSGGVKIRWEEQGEGDPLLLIQGLGYALEMWHRSAPLLGERYRVITYDNRGVGQSDLPEGPYSTAAMAEDGIAVLDAAGVERAHVLGASLGGMIAQELVLAHPERVRSLILCCTTCGGPAFVPAEAEVYEALQARATMGPEEGVRATIPFTYDPGTPRDRIEEDLAVRMRVFPRADGYLAQLAASLGHDAHDRVGAIGVPTLVVHGESDRLIRPENGRELADRIPGARFTLLPNTSHIMFTDQPERIHEEITGFLDEVSAETGA
jgi:pimeloyl-ACP methyl ester carboxylesterase